MWKTPLESPAGIGPAQPEECLMTRILIVEDSPTQAEETRFILQEAGFTVEVARNGHMALQRLAAEPFDLVLSDVLMPEISGYDLCRRIKTDPRTRSIPVVLLTFLTDPMDVLRGLESGADNFLTKPYDPRYLVHRIQTTLDNVRGKGQGTPMFFRGQGISVTADKAQIIELLLATLEEFIRSRDREMQARAAGEALAEASRRKDQFLAMLAHELRNPLVPLRIGLHLLRHPTTDNLTREQALDSAERQVRHLGRMVDDLLDASRLSSGRLQLQRERLDLARLVRLAAEDRRAWLEQAGLTLSIATPEVPVWINGDDTRLSQAIHNLLDNAGRFTDRGGRVSVRLEAGANEAAITVIDTGIGIDPELLPAVFNVFVQARQTLERPQGGLGLGLSLVKGVIEMHGGRVHAFSDGPGRGAVFTLWLPIEPEPAALDGTSQEGPASAEGRLRLLVIEDNRDAADSLRMFLELLGHEVAVAYTGPEGVRIAREIRPTAVISDIGLPGLDGYGVAGALRRDPATKDAMLIGVSGYGQEEDIRRARDAGFDHYLVKPAAPETLQKLLVSGGRT
jgi:signal transduction histidine kinase